MCTVPAAEAVSADITGLTPSTTYHYRLVAINKDGTALGNDQVFTTAPAVTFPKPIKSVSAPHSAKHNHFFVVLVRLNNVRARVVFTLSLHGKIVKSKTVNRGPSGFAQRFKAPRKKGHYTLRVTGSANGVTNSFTKKIKVF
jgi:hypothetical protein